MLAIRAEQSQVGREAVQYDDQGAPSNEARLLGLTHAIQDRFLVLRG